MKREPSPNPGRHERPEISVLKYGLEPAEQEALYRMMAGALGSGDVGDIKAELMAVLAMVAEQAAQLAEAQEGPPPVKRICGLLAIMGQLHNFMEWSTAEARKGDDPPAPR